MSGIIVDFRAGGSAPDSVAELGCDGSAIPCKRDDFEAALTACLSCGMDTYAVVSAGDDEAVERLYADKGPALFFACDAGLTETARLRELAPGTQWVPIADVYKSEASYDFAGDAYQGGFKTYQMNPSTFEERRVHDNGLLLADWIDRAKHLGFERVWIDSSEAQNVGKGFDLIAARRASKEMDGGVWFSGGGTTLDHVRNLMNECPINSVVLSGDMIAEIGMAELRAVLDHDTMPADEGGAAETDSADAPSAPSAPSHATG